MYLDYSNEHLVNIIPKEGFEELTLKVFQTIAENLSKSLGPLGSSAIILDGMMTESTKDGHDILSKYRFRNRYMKMIYNLIKAPCTRMNNTVGDGTTTAIVLTNALFKRYKMMEGNLYTLYRLPRQFTNAWNDCIGKITELIQNQAVMINTDDYQTIYNIAYVTSNGNHEISDAIASVYRDAKSPSIKMKDSPTNKSYISPINGFDFPANMISDAFVRNQDLSSEEKDIMVMMFDHKIETDFFLKTIIPIQQVIEAQNKKLLILAPYYDKYMCDTVVDQFITKEFRQFGHSKLIMAQYDLSKLGKNQLHDLAVVLRGKVITQEMAGFLTIKIENDNIDSIIENILENKEYEFYHYIGNAAEAQLSCKSGSIFRVEDIETYQEYMDTLNRAKLDLQELINQTDNERQSYAHKIYEAKARVSQLEMKNFIYYIGADSDLQKQIIRAAVDDVIKCVRSAIKSGIVPGCQISIIKAATTLMAEILEIDYDEMTNESVEELLPNISDEDRLRYEIFSMINAAVTDVYMKVLHGSEGDGIVKTLPRWQYAHTTKEQENVRQEAIDKSVEIVLESVKRNQAFDIEHLKYSPDIITSAETDTMVLSVASELVKILIAGNQCIFLDSDIDGSHEESVEVYV